MQGFPDISWPGGLFFGGVFALASLVPTSMLRKTNRPKVAGDGCDAGMLRNLRETGRYRSTCAAQFHSNAAMRSRPLAAAVSTSAVPFKGGGASFRQEMNGRARGRERLPLLIAEKTRNLVSRAFVSRSGTAGA